MTLGIGIFVAACIALAIVVALLSVSRCRTESTEKTGAPSGPNGVEEIEPGKYHVRFGREEWRCDDHCNFFRYPSGTKVRCGHEDWDICFNAVNAFQEDKRVAARRLEWGLVSAVEIPQRKWRRRDYESQCGVS